MEMAQNHHSLLQQGAGLSLGFQPPHVKILKLSATYTSLRENPSGKGTRCLEQENGSQQSSIGAEIAMQRGKRELLPAFAHKKRESSGFLKKWPRSFFMEKIVHDIVAATIQNRSGEWQGCRPWEPRWSP
jgi:hypothetical protein